MDNQPQGQTPEDQQVDQEAVQAPSEPTPEVTPASKEPESEHATDEESIALENSKNPERTKQYIEKLKAERDELRKAKDQENYGNSVFDSFRAPPTSPEVQHVTNPAQYQGLNQGQVDSITSRFIDHDGSVDVQGLERFLKDSNERALRAEQIALSNQQQITRYEEDRQVKETHAVYPELSPFDEGGNKNSAFDPNFYDLVRDRMVRNYAEGKNLSFLQTANQIRKVYQPATPVNVEKEREQAVENFKTSQTQQRDQAPLESGKGAQRSGPDHDDLRRMMRDRNGRNPNADRALAERLKRAGL